MATYKIDYLNNSADIVDPTIEFTELLKWDVNTKIGNVLVILTVANATFAVEVPGVSLPTVNAGTITAQGQIKLDELYKI